VVFLPLLLIPLLWCVCKTHQFLHSGFRMKWRNLAQINPIDGVRISEFLGTKKILKRIYARNTFLVRSTRPIRGSTPIN